MGAAILLSRRATRFGSFGRWPRPLVLGHRGASARAPENTMAAFRAALDDGAAGIECDLRHTRDRLCVAVHDRRLDRTTDISGAIAAIGARELAAVDAGSWFAPAFAGERVPELASVQALLRARGGFLNAEVKSDAGDATRLGAAVARALVRGHGPALISSFDGKALLAARRVAPGLARGLLFERLPRRWRLAASRVGAHMVVLDHRRLGRRLVRAIHHAGLEVGAYTVNRRDRARLLAGWGLSVIITDRPGAIVQALEPGPTPRPVD